jgi:DNA polymerase phi
VLDLLDIFIKKQSSSPLILDLILPLLSLIRNGQGHTDMTPLVNRAENLFRNKLCKTKEYPKENLDRENAHTILEQLLHIAQTAPSVDVVTLATHGCMFIVRVLKGNKIPYETSPVRTRASAAKQRRTDRASSSQKTEVAFGLIDVPRFCNAFGSALRNFMEMRNTRLHPVLFTELIVRHPDVSWLLAKDLAETLSSAVNHYRRTQACLMLTQLLSKKCVFVESLFRNVCPVIVDQFLQVDDHLLFTKLSYLICYLTC